MRVALVVMPFAAADRPSLAAGVLKASLADHGIECDVKYFNLLLWKMLGHEPYTWFVHEASMVAFSGEWVFSQALFADQVSTWERYQAGVLDVPIWGMRTEDRGRIREAIPVAKTFLDLAHASTDWSRFDVVGFTSTFQQTVASLALAKRIRQSNPRVVLVAGGANFTGSMGRPYLETFEQLDYVCTGEAEQSFPELCSRLEQGRTDPPAGFLHRQGENVTSGGRKDGFTDLDTLSTPDFDDYFRVLHANDVSREIVPWLQVEASRGCFWGQKSQCTFCGLNGDSLAYRRKAWRRVVEETDALQGRHGPIPLHFADNILAMRAFEDLIPFWADRCDAIPKHFEVKANLSRRHVQLLKAAGVTSFQAGVESLSDHTLKLMRKGVTAAQNVALLRWSAETRIHSMWNLLFGFPGESPENTEAMLALLRKLVHLRPPDGCAPIRMDRFSPNFERSVEMGFSDVEPLPAYRHIYPMSETQLREAACFFTYEHPGRKPILTPGIELMRFAQGWRERWRGKTNGRLALMPHLSGGRILVDDRFGRSSSAERLSPGEEALLIACDAPTSRDRALAVAAQYVPNTEARMLAPALVSLIDGDIIAEIGESLVTLALLPQDLELNGLARAS